MIEVLERDKYCYARIVWLKKKFFFLLFIVVTGISSHTTITNRIIQNKYNKNIITKDTNRNNNNKQRA